MNKKLKITVEGKTYEVLVEALDAPASAPAVPAPVAAAPVTVSAPVVAAAPKAAAPAAGVAGDVLSPLAGKVVEVKVSVGQAVKAGDEVVTVEAMKMNTPVHAAKDGKVEAVYVKAGDPAAEGQPLLKIS